jgi:hypothetical protein
MCINMKPREWASAIKIQFPLTKRHGMHYEVIFCTGADPGFQVRGGALKKIAPSEGKRENFWGISCEKSRFYAKTSYFFQLRREAQNLLGYFVWKITILRQKIIFFPILGGGGVRLPLDPPLLYIQHMLKSLISSNIIKFLINMTTVLKCCST